MTGASCPLLLGPTTFAAGTTSWPQNMTIGWSSTASWFSRVGSSWLSFPNKTFLHVYVIPRLGPLTCTCKRIHQTWRKLALLCESLLKGFPKLFQPALLQLYVTFRLRNPKDAKVKICQFLYCVTGYNSKGTTPKRWPSERAGHDPTSNIIH